MLRRVLGAAAGATAAIALPAAAVPTNVFDEGAGMVNIVSGNWADNHFGLVANSAGFPLTESRSNSALLIGGDFVRPGQFFDNVTGQAEAFSTSGSILQNGRLGSVSITGSINTVIPHQTIAPELFDGNFGAGALSQLNIEDTVFIDGRDANDHRAVTLHKQLLLSGGADANVVRNDAAPDSSFSAGASSTLSLFSEGIGPGVLGGSTFGEFSFSDGNDGTRFHSSSALQTVVDFTLHVTLGQANVFNITMTTQGSSSLLDRNGGAVSDFVFGSGYTLAWSPDTFVTDDATGGFLHDFSIGSSSGFNYAGLDVGGPGASILDGGSGGGGPTSGAPEPSAWALAVLGFGLLGGALRRRRAAVTGPWRTTALRA